MEKRIIRITAEEAEAMHRALQPVKLTKKQILREVGDCMGFALYIYLILWHGLAL